MDCRAWLAYCLLLLGTRPSVLLARGTFEFRYPVDMNIPPGKFGCYFPLDNPKNHRQSPGMTYPFYATFPYHGAGGPLLVQNTTSTWLTRSFNKSYDGVQLSCAPSDDKVDTSHLTLVLQEPLEFNSSDLTFTYAPSRQITCAINAKNAHYVWSMNTAGPYPNQREVQFNGSQCSGCNASASRRVQCAQATLGKCIQTTSQENVVVVQFGCYGCLRCTATVPYGNESQVGFYDYGLTQPYDTTPGSGTVCKGPSRVDKFPTLSPAGNHILGKELTITFGVFAAQFQVVASIMRDGQNTTVDLSYPFTYQVNMSRMDNDPCSAIYRVTIFSLQPWHTGEWLFTVYSTDGNQSAVASTEISTEINVIDQPCGSQGIYCGGNGTCVLDARGKPFCACLPAIYGRACQYGCPHTDSIVTKYLASPALCAVRLILLCTESGSAELGDVYWNVTGQPLRYSRVYYVEAARFSRQDVGKYVCQNETNVLNTVTLDLAESPVLIPALVADYQSREIRRSGEVSVPVQKPTFNESSLSSRWSKMSGGAVCGGVSAWCLKAVDSDALQFHQVPGCDGQYRGCAVNSFGENCFLVNVTVNTTVCPAQTFITIVSGVNGTSNPVVWLATSSDMTVFWIPEGASAISSIPHSAFNSSSCCAAYTPGEELKDGSYIVCVSNSSSEHDCIVSLQVTVSGRSMSSETNVIVAGSVSGSVVVIAIIIVIAGLLYRYRRGHHPDNTPEGTRQSQESVKSTSSTSSSSTSSSSSSLLPGSPINISNRSDRATQRESHWQQPESGSDVPSSPPNSGSHGDTRYSAYNSPATGREEDSISPSEDPIVEQSGAHSHDNASRPVATSVAHSAQQIGEDLAAQSKPSGVPTLGSVPEDDGGTTVAQQDSNPPKRVHDNSNLESGHMAENEDDDVGEKRPALLAGENPTDMGDALQAQGASISRNKDCGKTQRASNRISASSTTCSPEEVSSSLKKENPLVVTPNAREVDGHELNATSPIDFQPFSSGDIPVASSSSFGCQSSPENNHHDTHPFSSQSEGSLPEEDPPDKETSPFVNGNNAGEYSLTSRSQEIGSSVQESVIGLERPEPNQAARCDANPSALGKDGHSVSTDV